MSKNPCFYLKVPHYLASWIRNVDHDRPLQVGAPVVMEWGTRLSQIFALTAMPNLNNNVQPRCLTQKQWEQMQKGLMLVSKSGELRMSVSRPVRQPLQMHEILHSLDCDEDILRDPRTGKPEADTAYFDVYMPFQMPDFVIRNERECRVQSDWYMPDPKPFIDELMNRYKMSLLRFIFEKRMYNMRHGIFQPQEQVVKSFMDWYNLRPGLKEERQIRQMLRRMRERHMLSLGPSATRSGGDSSDADIANMTFDLECQYACASPTDKQFTFGDEKPFNAARRVFCPETGVTYDSVRAAAIALDMPDSTARSALQRGNKTRNRQGRKLTLMYDEEVTKTKTKTKNHRN